MPGCELNACFLAVSEESAECAFVAGVDAFGFDELVVSAHDVGDDGFLKDCSHCLYLFAQHPCYAFTCFLCTCP